MNIFRLAEYTLIAMVMFTNISWAGPTLAGLMVFYSLVFYYTVCRILLTLDVARISDLPEDLQQSTLGVVGIIVSLVALVKLTPYTFIAIWCAPWVILASITVIFGWLVVFEIIDIVEKD